MIRFEKKPDAKADKGSRGAKGKPNECKKSAAKPAAKPKAARAPKAKAAPRKKPAAKKPEAEKKTSANAGNRKLTDSAKVIEVLRHCGGIITVAADKLNVSRPTLYRFIEEHQEVEDALVEINCEIGDIAEAKIITAIKAGDMQTVRWSAETKMKDRGYSRRVENVGKGGGPMETRQAPDLSGYTDDELEKMAAIEEARDKRKAEDQSG